MKRTHTPTETYIFLSQQAYKECLILTNNLTESSPKPTPYISGYIVDVIDPQPNMPEILRAASKDIL